MAQQQAFTQQLQQTEERLAATVCPVRLIIPDYLIYTGAATEDYDEWLHRLNNQAIAEGWTLANKRTAAPLTLRGCAYLWHRDFGDRILSWEQWEEALRSFFVEPMDEIEWRLMMELRVQLPDEPSNHYILQKNAMFRKRPGQVTPEAERIDYLLRGLHSSEAKVAVLATSPVTVGAFIDTVKRIEDTLRNPFDNKRIGVLAGLLRASSEAPTFQPTVLTADQLAETKQLLLQSQQVAQGYKQLIQQQQLELHLFQCQLSNECWSDRAYNGAYQQEEETSDAEESYQIDGPSPELLLGGDMSHWLSSVP